MNKMHILYIILSMEKRKEKNNIKKKELLNAMLSQS